MHTWDHFHSLFRPVPRLPEAAAPGPSTFELLTRPGPAAPPLLHQPRPLLDTRRASTEPSGQGWRETAFISSLLLFSLYKPPSPSRRPPSSNTGAPRGTLQCAPPLDAGSPKAIRGSWPGRRASVVSAQGLVPLRWGCALRSPNAPGKAPNHMLNNTPLCICTTAFLSIHLLMDI